jgi:hypothetical protein
LLIGNLLQSQEVTPSSHHSIMRWLLESASSFSEAISASEMFLLFVVILVSAVG